MLELTPEQHDALKAGDNRAWDPETKTAYVVIPVEQYERLKSDLYDDSPWTDEEMAQLALEDANRLGWEGWKRIRIPMMNEV